MKQTTLSTRDYGPKISQKTTNWKVLLDFWSFCRTMVQKSTKAAFETRFKIASWVFYVAILISLLECYMWLSSSKATIQETQKTYSWNLIMNEWLKYIQIHLIHTFYSFFDWNCAENHSKYAVKQTDFIVFFWLL
jgi:hypothetical protein